MIKRIPEILQDAVARITPTAQILSIVDNADNTYTVNFAKYSNNFIYLIDTNIIEIVNTAGFDGAYKISGVSALSLKIEKTE